MGDDWGYSGWDASDLFGGGGDADDDEHDNKAAGEDSEVQVLSFRASREAARRFE